MKSILKFLADDGESMVFFYSIKNIKAITHPMSLYHEYIAYDQKNTGWKTKPRGANRHAIKICPEIKLLPWYRT
jgi:hypothetical protein